MPVLPVATAAQRSPALLSAGWAVPGQAAVPLCRAVCCPRGKQALLPSGLGRCVRGFSTCPLKSFAAISKQDFLMTACYSTRTFNFVKKKPGQSGHLCVQSSLLSSARVLWFSKANRNCPFDWEIDEPNWLSLLQSLLDSNYIKKLFLLFWESAHCSCCDGALQASALCWYKWCVGWVMLSDWFINWAPPTTLQQGITQHTLQLHLGMFWWTEVVMQSCFCQNKELQFCLGKASGEMCGTLLV